MIPSYSMGKKSMKNKYIGIGMFPNPCCFTHMFLFPLVENALSPVHIFSNHECLLFKLGCFPELYNQKEDICVHISVLQY